jgi:hypothetical protein
MDGSLQSLDWSTAILLAAVTVLEGFRRVPARTAIVSRIGTSPWTWEGEIHAGGLRLVSWASPFLLHLLLPPADTAPPPPDLRRRWRRVRRWFPLLRCFAALEWLLLVLGVPLAIAQWGRVGLVLAVGGVFQGALLLAILSACSLEQARLPEARIIRAVRALLSPFAAPRAPEIVAESALAGAAPLEALRMLLPAREYSALLRPLAYDIEHQGLDPAILASVPARVVRTILNGQPPDSAGAPFCPRCERTYQRHMERCEECEGVPLVSGEAGKRGSR